MSLRNLVKQRKNELKISHPYARYNIKGLSCSLCSLPVKHESLWAAHLTSKQHRTNVQQAELRKRQEQEEASLKRQSIDDEEVADEDDDPQEEQSSSKRARIEGPANGLPADFFDDPSQAPTAVPHEFLATATPMDQDERDPDADDEEWDAFEKEILAEPSTSSIPVLTAGPSISAPAKLVDAQGNEITEDGVRNIEEIDEEPKESEEERREREDREELMARIDEEEREQQEADARVTTLRARLELIRKSKTKERAK